jgi:hypothetical protein
MQFLAVIPLVLTVFISAASGLAFSQAQDVKIEFLADLTNQLNEDMAHTTQFFGAFPRLSGSALASQASAAQTALQDAIGVVDTIAQELANDAIAQGIKSDLLDNDLLLDISLQLQDFAEVIEFFQVEI